jgi:putative restriction endonuclease
VRVIRGPDADPAFAPKSGYRYDGLFRVDSAKMEVGRSGFGICRFVMRSLDPQAQAAPADAQTGPASRVESHVQRTVRSTKVIERIKHLYNSRCQVCRQRIDTPRGPYSEGAHVQGLGEPHNGPEIAENLLCLCPNDHVRFDNGALPLGDDGDDLEILSQLVKRQARPYTTLRVTGSVKSLFGITASTG